MSKDSSFYNTEFERDAVGFMKKYSCDPVGDLNHTGVVETPFSNGYASHKIAQGNLIAWLDFQKVHKKKPTDDAVLRKVASVSDKAGYISVRGSYTPDTTKVEAYFLPWTQDGVIRLQIPQMPVGQGPKYFFTAGLSGCSIIIKGTADAPLIFHAGGSTGTTQPSEGADFWRRLIESNNATSGGNTLAEANKTNYQVDKVKVREYQETSFLTNQVQTKYAVSQFGTANSRKFEGWVKKKVSSQFLVESVDTTGCVMGIRQPNGHWWFYLQENGTIKYFSITSSYFGLKKQKIEGTEKNVMRPMQFTRFYPGSGHVKLKPKLSRVLKD